MRKDNNTMSNDKDDNIIIDEDYVIVEDNIKIEDIKDNVIVNGININLQKKRENSKKIISFIFGRKFLTFFLQKYIISVIATIL